MSHFIMEMYQWVRGKDKDNGRVDKLEILKKINKYIEKLKSTWEQLWLPIGHQSTSHTVCAFSLSWCMMCWFYIILRELKGFLCHSSKAGTSFTGYWPGGGLCRSLPQYGSILLAVVGVVEVLNGECDFLLCLFFSEGASSLWEGRLSISISLGRQPASHFSEGTSKVASLLAHAETWEQSISSFRTVISELLRHLSVYLSGFEAWSAQHVCCLKNAGLRRFTSQYSQHTRSKKIILK